MVPSAFDDEQLPDVRLVRPYLDQAWSDRAGPEHTPSGSPLRPFMLTSGRVAAEADLAIETQVVSTGPGLGRRRALPFERGDIVALCTTPLSVAEVAARLGLHLSVVRVLVSDLNADGDLAVYQPPTDTSRDVNTLLRVIRGLRNIS